MVMGPKTRSLILLLVAAGGLCGAAMLHEPLKERSEKYELASPSDTTPVSDPIQTLLTLAPGGLRAPIVAVLWIRAEELKEKGRYHEMRDLSEWICRFMPRYPGVWTYHAWNMAWNVSVTAHGGDERWRWLESGINLLRDRGLALNPTSLGIYKELAWIFYEKLGQGTDDMHHVYKQTWAERMQHLLAAPPYGTTAETIDALRPIAAAPLDTSPYRPREGSWRGQHRRGMPHDDLPRWDAADSAIQRDQLLVLLKNNADVQAFADDLAALGLKIDESLLEAYSRYALDPAMEVVRLEPPELKTDTDRAISALINDPARTAARDKALALVRAHVLWNAYRMDPAWMLHVMETYNVPLDWRLAPSHALYWVTLGQKRCNQIIGAGDSLNIERTLLYSLRDMSRFGRLLYRENRDDPTKPYIQRYPDWRYIEPTHLAHIEMGKIVLGLEKKGVLTGTELSSSKFRTGHVNYMSEAIEMLYRAGRRAKAQEYFDWIKDRYALKGKEWDLPLDEYVVEDMRKGGVPIQSLANTQIWSAITSAYEHLARGDRETYEMCMAHAIRVYGIYQPQAPPRLKLPEWRVVVAAAITPMLAHPGTVVGHMSLTARHDLYVGLDTQVQVLLYDLIAPTLRRQCERADPPLDFDKAFPVPPGIEAHREQMRRQAEQRRVKAQR